MLIFRLLKKLESITTSTSFGKKRINYFQEQYRADMDHKSMQEIADDLNQIAPNGSLLDRGLESEVNLFRLENVDPDSFHKSKLV